MPAPKRGSASPDLQPKIRKLDEDEEAPSATIESTTNSFKTEIMQENTAAAPRTKKKRLAVEQGNYPDNSSNQSSPLKESSKTTPDPPVKKAKLLNATSASCEETPSQRANFKVSMKQTASTDSDEDLSNDSSKVDLIREKDDEDKAHCIRIYSNKIKAVYNAEESSSDPQETSQDLSSSPLDPVQKDHSYGRFSESLSPENTGEADDKGSAESFTEQRSKEISHDETQKVLTDTLVSEIGSSKTSVKVESATEKGKYVELQYSECQTPVDNKTPAASQDMQDCVIPVGEENEKQDETEFNKSQEDVDNTLALPEKTLCDVTGGLHSSDEGSQLLDERTDSVCRSTSPTHLITQFLSEENEQNIKNKTKEEEESESAEIRAEKLDGVLLNETNYSPEQVEISNVEGQPEENEKMAEFVTISNTQIDLSDQVASKEDFNATYIQAETPDTLKKSEDKFEESARDGVDFQPPQTSACSEALVEVHLNHGIVTPDSCTDTLSECMVVQNQTEMLSDNFKVPEGQTPEVVLQSEENHLIYDKATKEAAETERDSSNISEEKDKSIQCSAEIKGNAHTSHPDATVKTQNLDASESTTDFHEGHGGDKFKTMENEDTVDAESESEAETSVTPEISNSEPAVETQKQEIQEVSESTIVTSSEIHGSVTADKCENMKTVACAVIAEAQSGTETVAAFKLSDPAAKVELQIQESPVNKHPAVVPDDGQESPENANVSITAENVIEVDVQTTAMSEEFCAQMEETHSQMIEVSECTIDICATQCQMEFDVLSDATSEEVSNITHIEEMPTPRVSESTTNMQNANCATQSLIEVVENLQVAVISEKVLNITSIEEIQTSMVSEPATDTPDDAYSDLEDAAFKSSKYVKCVSAVASNQIEVDVDTSSSEKVSNVEPIEVMQSQMVSKSITDTSVEVFGNHREENLKTVANDEFKFESPAVTSNQLEVETTFSMESSNSAPSLSLNKSQTEEDMQTPDNDSSTAFGVETQTQKIQDVGGQTTDNTDKELLEDKTVENVKNEDAVNSECVTVQEDQLESEMQITPDSVISGANRSEEIQKSPNEMDMLTVTTEQYCNIPAVEIQNLKSLDVNEENTDTQSVADEESQNKMETSFSPPSAETQNQRCFDVTDSSTDVSDQVQENFRTSTNVSFENENKAIEECVPAAVRANKMEMQAAEGLQENSQPNTTKQIESHRGQEVHELTTETNISVSQTSSETSIQKSVDVTEPEKDSSVTARELFRVPSDECHENEEKVIKESVGTAEWTNTMETQKADLLEEVSQPTATEQTQSQRGPEVSELTTDTDISVLPPPPETQIQRSFDITDPASEVSKTVQKSFKIPSNECHENKAIEEYVDDEMTNEMETQTEMLKEDSPQTSTEQTQSWRGQELSEHTTDVSVSSPSSEIQIQKSLNVESAVNVSETAQTTYSITSNKVHKNENDILEKSVDTAERMNTMETQAADMSVEVSQLTTSEKRQNLRGQEVSELTTDTNISVSQSSSETHIQMSSIVTDFANDASETVLESFRIPSNDHHENEKFFRECADTAERTCKMEIHAAEMLKVSQPTVTEQTQTLRPQEVSEVPTDTDVCVSPASAETQIHISLDINEASTNKSETVQEVFSIPLNECHENVKNTIEEFADTAEMTNEMEIQTTEAVGEIFQPTATEQTQNLTSQEVSELTINTNISVSPPSTEAEMERRIVVTEPTSDLFITMQENFTIPPNETNENEHEGIEKCVDTAEMINEMEVQTEAVVEIFQPTTEQTQNQTADEVSETQTLRHQEDSEVTIVTDMSVSPPSPEINFQKISITEPTNDLSTTDQENVKIPQKENEIEAIEECVHSAERTNEMETQPAELLQEISQPTITKQSQNQRNQEVCEHTTDTEVESNPINTESEKSTNSISTFENHPTIAWQTSTPESYERFDSELQNQKNEEVGQVYKIKDEDASECENIPEIETNMESSAESKEISYSAAVEQQNHLAKETTEHTTDLSDEIQTSCPIVNLENKENDRQTEHENVQGDVMCGSKERTESVLLEDIKIAESVSNTEEGAERSEVFVCDQSENTDVSIQAPEGQIKMVNQSEVNFHENHVVYEPISSPESNSGGEVCTIQLGETISFLDLHSTETHQILVAESNFITSDDKLKITHPKLEDEEIVKKDVCASDSQAVVLMEVETTSEAQCPAHAHLEQSNMSEDVKHIAAIGSSDISLADGQSQDATEKSERSVILECISAAELTEQVQEDTGVQDATGNVTTTTPALTEVKITDVSSEEYLILEPVPVPESEVHFDIVTQAAAESGLSASLGPDEEMTSQSILSSSQQAEILEAGEHQGETTNKVKETTVTSSGEVLEQQVESTRLQDAPVSDHLPPSATVDVDTTNSDHTSKDSNEAVMETVESVVDQEEVQILEDMEIGREIVVAEEDNEEDSDVVIIKPPDEPTDGSFKKSEEKVNDEKKHHTSKIAKLISAEKTEDEKRGQEFEKPKKQEMNMQARTKARLAALAEQKAAAAKRSANRQQLNLLALCQEIAEDIATDSMLLKKIEEEKQAAAAAEAAKAEAIEKEPPAAISQEAEPDNLVTPAGPEESSASVTPTPEPPAVQPSTTDSVETKPAAEPPKRRFFISQISVPLKAHEKKKLTRYQRLRQVELQREKMSWARVKKLKSDQTNQMFSDVDWQASFSGSFLMSSTTPPPAAASPSKTSSVSSAATTQPAQAKGDSPKVETSTSELVNTGADKAESIKTESPETEPVKTEATKTEPTKTQPSKTKPTKTEPSKTEPTKTEPSKVEATKTEAPISENRRITRQSKAQASQASAVAPKPAPKVTRSSKRTLPAVPPPMPNGLNAQKQKPVEYKPYRPRPKYSFDDFELDDDDSLLVSQIKPNLPTQPPRPSLQPSPTAHSKLPLKPTISSQPANQAKLKSQTAPPGQVSTQSRPTAAAQAPSQSAKSKPTVTATTQSKPTTAASSKPVPSTSTQLTTPVLAASQSKPVSASAQPKPAASASPSSPTAGVNVTKQLAPAVPQPASSAATETKPAAAKADDASAPQKMENPPSQEKEKCKNAADALSSLPASSLPSVESFYNTKKSEESPADTTPNSSADYQSKTARTTEKTENRHQDSETKPQDAATFVSDASLQKEVNKLKEADKDGTQTIIDAGQKHFGPVACSGCGMLYSAANPEDEAQHLLFHNQFVSAVKYVGWKKERILAEYPDGKIILVLPDDPKYALKKVEEIREMVDNDLGFQQVETKCPSKTKTFLFISIDKKVAGCLIAEHIQEGYRVIEEPLPEGSEGEKVLFERQKAWCCSTTPEPAICGISRIWVASMMRRQGIATRMIECLRNNFIYGSYLRKDEIAFSDPTPDGKLFASHYFGTSQFLVYNFVSGPRSFQPKTQAV